MKCEELLTLNEAVEGTVELTMRQEFEHHGAGGNRLKVGVVNIRKMISLCEREEPCELPEEGSRRLPAQPESAQLLESEPGTDPTKPN